MGGTTHIHIFLADDDKDDCQFFQEALDELPLKTTCTALYDGEQLMVELNKHKQKLPDVLFLDVNMPRKNGIDCLLEIKRDDDLKALPVIVLSTSYDIRIADTLYEAGALYYICKPPDFTQLKKIILTALECILSDQTRPARENFLLCP